MPVHTYEAFMLLKPNEKCGRPAKTEPTVRKSPRQSANGSAAEVSSPVPGFEAKLWQLANAFGGSMDAAEYKHFCVGLPDFEGRSLA